MKSDIERIELAPGFSISRVLTGLWQIADMERDGLELDIKETAKAMAPYIDSGYTTFDMADHYGSSEKITGLFKKEHGSEIQLLTKWVPKPGPLTRDDVRSAIQLSLDRMQTEQLDVLQFHAWNYADPIWLDSLFWLQELKEEGLIRFLGLTNMDTAHLRIAINSGIEIVSNQVCFSLLDQRASGRMTDLCLKHGIKLLAFGTVAGGFLTERWLNKPEPKPNELKTWSQMKYKRFIDSAGGWKIFQDLLGLLNRLAAKHKVSMANIACRAMLESPAVGGVIIGARLGKSEHIKDNMQLFQFTLDANDHRDINNILKKFTAIPGDCGDEYRKPPFLTASGDLSHHLKAMPNPYDVHKTQEGKQKVFSGTTWEDIGGFCRAVRQNERILISGTTATHNNQVIGGSDPAAQLHFTIDKIEGVLQSLGGRLEDVIRTRIFIRNMHEWEIFARVHGERFGETKPVNTIVQAGIIGEEYLVELEAEAIVNE